MPRPRREAPAPNSLIASAAVLTRPQMARPKGNGAQEWQRDAWYFYDSIGEFRYACDWRAAACSRVRLTIVEAGPDGDTTITDGPEVEALAVFGGGEAGRSQILGTIALHFDVPGETYIVGEVVPSDYDETVEVDRWTVYSNEELSLNATTGVWTVDRGDGKKRPLVEDALVIRLWRSHPRKWVEATSPARAALPVLRELEGLSKRTGAAIDSRLAGAGLLLVPSEMRFSPPPGVDVGDTTQLSDADRLLATLTEAMTTAIKDRNSAAAVAPIVASAPGAVLEHIKHITFSTPLDERTDVLQEKDLRRVALSMDMPPEVLLGVGDVNHWSAWQIDESALKTAIEPLLETMTAGLTERWLYPAVEALAGKQAVNTNRRIGFDTTDLRARPNRSAEALNLHARLMLTDEALRRESGFDEGDAPGEAEIQRRLILAAAQAGQPPEVAAAALAYLGVNLDVPEPPADVPALPAPDTPPAEVPPPPENVRNPPAPAAVLACAELLVHRAVERANNRINRRGRRRPIPDAELDTALAGAWDQVERTAGHLQIDAAAFQDALDRYARGLLRTGVEHSPSVLGRVLIETDRRQVAAGG